MMSAPPKLPAASAASFSSSSSPASPLPAASSSSRTSSSSSASSSSSPGPSLLPAAAAAAPAAPSPLPGCISDEKNLRQAVVLAASRYGTEHDDGRFATLFAYFSAVCKNKDKSCSARCTNYRDDGGRTSLHYMAMKGAKDFVSQLLDLGADPNLQDGQGQTPYHLALKEKHADIALMLLERNDTNVNIQDAFGRLATHWACLAGFDEVLSLVIAKGADVNALTQSGDTALHWAAAEGHLTCVKVLLANGANSTVRNSRGKTAAEVATDPSIAEAIVAANQDVAFSVADEKGNSCSAPNAPDTEMSTEASVCPSATRAAKCAQKKKPQQKKINITLKK